MTHTEAMKIFNSSPIVEADALGVLNGIIDMSDAPHKPAKRMELKPVIMIDRKSKTFEDMGLTDKQTLIPLLEIHAPFVDIWQIIDILNNKIKQLDIR